MESLSDTVKGHPRLAMLFGLVPQIACYRKFSPLGNRILAYYQARLIGLEKRLCELEKKDSTSHDGERRRYSRDWYFLADSVNDGNWEQWKVIQEIRSVIAEYCISRCKIAEENLRVV